MKSFAFSIVVPIYNEEEILEAQVNKLMTEVNRIVPLSDYEIVLVENGSKDKTLQIAQRIAKNNTHVRVVKLEKPSYGQAFKEGVRHAKYDVVFQFDIDFWDIDFLEISLLLMRRYDFIIGSKNMGSSKDHRPLVRKFLSKTLEVFLKSYFGVPFSDTHGMKAMKRNLVLPLLDQIESQNHFFDSELMIVCHYLHYSFKELPVRLEEIRSTRFSFLIRTYEAIREFAHLLTLKRLLVRFAFS